MANDVAMRWHNRSSAIINVTLQLLVICRLNVYFAKIIFINLFYYLAYLCYYSWVLLHFLVLFMGLIVLFQLTFTFIYNTINKISGSQTDHSVGLVGGVGKVGIENCRMMKKWEDIKYFIFSLFCLVGSGKVEKWKKRI